MLARAPAAFIGRAVERQGDRVTYVVEESVKGGLGERVEVRDEHLGVTSIGNLGVSDQQVALFLRLEGAGFSANGCSGTSPEAMRAAAASRYTRCARARVARLTTLDLVRRRLRLRAVLAHRDGSVIGATVRWGDGTSATVPTRRVAGADVVSVELTHRYDSAGRYHVRIAARSRPTLDCAIRGIRDTTEMSKPRARPVRVR